MIKVKNNEVYADAFNSMIIEEETRKNTAVDPKDIRNDVMTSIKQTISGFDSPMTSSKDAHGNDVIWTSIGLDKNTKDLTDLMRKGLTGVIVHEGALWLQFSPKILAPKAAPKPQNQTPPSVGAPE